MLCEAYMPIEAFTVESCLQKAIENTDNLTDEVKEMFLNNVNGLQKGQTA